ncbi:DMT family transporter [Mucilaginibacter calamicampi]|uniref:DMT family transporter n=1 Tax=Mucilaginibacter calamicampi TaxID=1302352 RepID=A0ABW2YT99_9SPHI
MNPKLSLALGIVCISLSPIFVKLAEASPVVCAFYRIFFGLIFLVPYCLIKQNLKVKRKDLVLALIGGLVFATDITLWNLSLKMISATVSTLLANLAPVWVGLISYFLFRKKVEKLFWIGTGAAVVGMLILVGLREVLHLQFGLGFLFAVVASMLYAIYILITKDILARMGTVTFMFYNMLAALVFLFIICLINNDTLINYPAADWLYFAGMGIICQLLGWLLINYAIRYIESTKVAITLLSQTVVAAVLAALMLSEKLSTHEVIGSLIVLAGIGITFLESKNNTA